MFKVKHVLWQITAVIRNIDKIKGKSSKNKLSSDLIIEISPNAGWLPKIH